MEEVETTDQAVEQPEEVKEAVKGEFTPQEFADEYQKLCEKMGYRINVNPAFIGRDDNTFSLVLQTSVGKLPKQE